MAKVRVDLFPSIQVTGFIPNFGGTGCIHDEKLCLHECDEQVSGSAFLCARVNKFLVTKLTSQIMFLVRVAKTRPRLDGSLLKSVSSHNSQPYFKAGLKRVRSKEQNCRKLSI